MKLTNEQLKTIYMGALFFEESSDGYLQAFQYTHHQMDYFKRVSDFWYDRCMASTAKTIECITSATEISFDYKLVWKGSDDSVELEVDGLITKIYYMEAIKENEEGTFTFELPEGEKKVVIYLPADATMWVKNMQMNADFKPVEKKEKVLWLGDSITQGYGPLRSSHTYVSVANKFLNYDIINQGIGGYVYDHFVIEKMGDYMPDKIIVSLGTNQYGDKTMKGVEEYYETMKEVYGDIPILCILPIWRGDYDDPSAEQTLINFCQGIKKVCDNYDNITVVDGFELVPHLPEYFLDNLHPNPLGAEIYGRNLVRAIEKVGF